MMRNKKLFIIILYTYNFSCNQNISIVKMLHHQPPILENSGTEEL